MEVDQSEFRVFLEYECANCWVSRIKPIFPDWTADYIVWKVKRKIAALKKYQEYKTDHNLNL